MAVPDDYLLIQYLYTGEGGAGGGMWTAAWETGGVTDPAQDAALVDAMADLVTGQLGSPVLFTSMRLIFGTADPSAPIVREVAAGFAGVASSDTPLNCAYLVRRTSVQGGRKNRGRMYLPGVVTATVSSDGGIDSGAVEDLQTAVDTWVSATTSALVAGDALTGLPVILLVAPEVTPARRQSNERAPAPPATVPPR